MYRGTTPSLTFKLDIDVNRITDLSIVFSQGGKIIYTKTKEDCQIVSENNSILVTLTQEETLELEPNKDMHVQLKLQLDNEKVSVSRYINIYVNDVIDTSIM